MYLFFIYNINWCALNNCIKAYCAIQYNTAHYCHYLTLHGNWHLMESSQGCIIWTVAAEVVSLGQVNKKIFMLRAIPYSLNLFGKKYVQLFIRFFDKVSIKTWNPCSSGFYSGLYLHCSCDIIASHYIQVFFTREDEQSDKFQTSFETSLSSLPTGTLAESHGSL